MTRNRLFQKILTKDVCSKFYEGLFEPDELRDICAEVFEEIDRNPSEEDFEILSRLLKEFGAVSFEAGIDFTMVLLGLDPLFNLLDDVEPSK